jgi:hypothetical protein
VCLFFPVERKLFDKFDTAVADLESNQDLHDRFKAWSSGRDQFNKELKGFDPTAVRQGWQKDYFQSAEETKPRPKDFPAKPTAE